ncbi:hypothetical protein D3C84_563170 [compost metagenome]
MPCRAAVVHKRPTVGSEIGFVQVTPGVVEKSRVTDVVDDAVAPQEPGVFHRQVGRHVLIHAARRVSVQGFGKTQVMFIVLKLKQCTVSIGVVHTELMTATDKDEA